MHIPIFDSNTHPTVDGKWMGKGEGNSFAELAIKLKEAGFIGACAVGLPTIEGWPRKEHIAACDGHGLVFAPVAALNPPSNDIPDEIRRLAKLGFKGVKVHPRLSNILISNHKALMIEILRAVEDNGIALFLCTYNQTKSELWPTTDSLVALAEIVKEASSAKLVLLHGGSVRLLEYAEFARFNPNILLDLSYTIGHWAGSSLDMDMRFVMRTLDRRVCLGSDPPEFSPALLRMRFEILSEGLSVEKIENVAFKNIMNFPDL